MVGTALTVDGTSTTVGDGTPASSNYVWNFGDTKGTYDSIAGFNASHVYTTAGKYTVSLTVTNDLGLTSTVSTTITIAADTRKVIYVDSSSGNDKNSGSSPTSALKTIYKAESELGNNTEILLKRGESFAMAGASMSLAGTNQLLGAYGAGANPVIDFTGTADYQNILTTSGNSDGVTFENLSINTVAGSIQSFGLEGRGEDVAVLNCTFNNVTYAVNANGEPTGLLVQNCSVPSKTGVYGYFVWGEGNDLSIFGNYVADSVNEHNVRATGYQGMNVSYNNFTNTDDKGCIECHDGEYAWVAHNTVSGGDIRVGPLGIASDPAGSNTTYAVIDSNTFNNSWMQVDPGSYHISIRNNVINRNSVEMIYLAGPDSTGRQDQDIQILNNTGVSDGTTGNFLKVGGPCSGVVLENNLVIAPDLTPGGYGTSIVYISQSNTNSFSKINGNVWQLPANFYSYADGGIMFLAPVTGSGKTGYLTPAAWNALSVVGNDTFTTTATSSSGTPVTTVAGGAATLDLAVPTPGSGSVAAKADSPIAGVFTDFYGDTRPTTGTWTAGAVQVGGNLSASPVATVNTGNGSSSTSSGGSTTGSGGTSSTSTGGVSGSVTDGGKGLAGITVYLDANNNSAHDSGEASTVTDSSGNYSFTGIAPGAYIVRQILPSGVKQTLPTPNYGNHITVSAGKTVTGQDFTDTGSISTGSTAGLPSGWTSTDIGSVGTTGSTTYSSSAGTYTVKGAGADIYGTADAFHLTYTTLSGNGTIVAEVSGLNDISTYAKAGVMIRSSTAANAQEVSLNLEPDKTAELDSRTATGGSTAYSRVSASSPEWVKLVRSGNTFSGYVSTDDKTWKLVSTVTVAMGTSVDVGLDVTSKNTKSLETATFSNVAITT